MKRTFGSDSADPGNESVSGLLHVLPVVGELLQETLFHQCPANINRQPYRITKDPGKGERRPIAKERQEEEEKLESRSRVANNSIRPLGLYLLVAQIRGREIQCAAADNIQCKRNQQNDLDCIVEGTATQ